MAEYHIRDLESLSGIKAHTIRIWEQRYGLFKPQRTPTNIRRYSDSDLKHLLNISLLKQKGEPISRLAALSRAALAERVKQLTSNDFSSQAQVHRLIEAMVDFNEGDFERLLNVNIAQLGFVQAMEHVILPFLEHIGVMWQSGSINVAQEHMISNLIRQKIIVHRDQLSTRSAEFKNRAILFLPEGELHELSLLYLDYLLRSSKCHTLYLGQNVPLQDLSEAVTTYRPDYGFCIMTSKPTAQKLKAYLSRLAELFAPGTVYVGGIRIIQDGADVNAQNLHYFRSRQELKQLLQTLFN